MRGRTKTFLGGLGAFEFEAGIATLASEMPNCARKRETGFHVSSLKFSGYVPYSVMRAKFKSCQVPPNAIRRTTRS